MINIQEESSVVTKLKENILLVRFENKYLSTTKKNLSKQMQQKLSSEELTMSWVLALTTSELVSKDYYFTNNDAAAVPAETSCLVERWPYILTWSSCWSGVGKQVWARNSLIVSFSHQYTYVLLSWKKLSCMTDPLEETELWQDNMHEKKVRLNSIAVPGLHSLCMHRNCQRGL